MTGRPTGLPAAPLLELIAARARAADMHPPQFMRDQFGHNADRSFQRWKSGGGVDRGLADRICVHLGIHPSSLWPAWDITVNHPVGAAMPIDDRSWQEQSACRDADPDLFFPDSPHEVPPGAQMLCMGCPVFDECFTYGLGQEHGVWANTSEDERRRIRKDRSIPLAPISHPLEESA